MGAVGRIAARLRQMPWRSIAAEAAERSLLVAKAFCCVHVVTNYGVSVALLQGPSMIPAFNLAGDVVLMEMITQRWGGVRHGDVVFVRSPEYPMKIVTKRVIGLAGDSVSFAVEPALGTKTETVVVPEGHVWVQGDNIYDSRDSRQFGPVPLGLLEGRAFLKVWPPNEFGLVKRSV